MSDTESSVTPVRWIGGLDDGYLEMIDESRLPDREVWLVIADADDVVEYIDDGALREPPALGTAAAYAVALVGRRAVQSSDLDGLGGRLEALDDRLRHARPETVEIGWALDRMREAVDAHTDDSRGELVERLFEEAQKISTELHAEN